MLAALWFAPQPCCANHGNKSIRRTVLGGDIGLYLTDIELGDCKRFDVKIRVSVEIKRRIGEQRLHVVLASIKGDNLLPIHRGPGADGDQWLRG